MDLFRKRLNDLLFESDLTTTAFAEAVGISRESMSSYLNSDKKKPDYKNLIKICEKLNVSADWLLGLSDVRTLDKSVTSACETLGISEPAALTIKNRNREHECLDTFSLLMEASPAEIENMKLGLDYCTNLIVRACQSGISPNEESVPFELTDKGLFFSDLEASKHFASIVGLSLQALLQEQYVAKVYDTLNNTEVTGRGQDA